MKKILITGGTGLLAVNFAYKLKDDYDVTLLTNSKLVQIPDTSVSNVSLENYSKLFSKLDKIKPDIIINAAGLTSVEKCEESPYSAYCSNVITAKNVAKASQELGCKLIHISTDHFSNSEKEYSSESEISIPLNQYGQTKLNGEFEVSRGCPNSIIVRTNFYGWGHEHRESFSDFIIENLRNENEITLFDDVYYSPILISNLLSAIMDLINSNASGIYNICGKERVSKYEFGLHIAETFSLNKNLIKKGSIHEKAQLTKRPLDMSLSTDKFQKEFPNTLLDLKSSLQALKEEEFSKLKEKIKTSVTAKESDNLIYYGKQTIDQFDIDSAISTLTKSFLTQGPKVREFEDKVAHYTGAKYAVAVSSLTAGFHIGSLAAGLKEGDKVITPPISFVTTSNSALYAGATPIFIDIDPKTLNLDVEKVAEAFKEHENIKAIFPVHFAGAPCDMEALKKIADENNAFIFEDAAHALGASYKDGTRVGNCENSLATGFSFHPVKSITCGEGGVITTNDDEFYKGLCRLRSHGIQKGNDLFVNKELAFTDGKANPWYYEMHQLGFNYRITDLQCALGISQLDKLDSFMDKRRTIAHKYDHSFSSLKNAKPIQVETRSISGNHLYVLKVNFSKLNCNRLELFEKFKKNGIALHVHYIPIPYQPYYRERFGSDFSNIPNSNEYYDSAVTLPIYPTMSDSDVQNVIASVNEIIG